MLNVKVIAVTGCAGYVGSQLVSQLLEKGYFVRGMDNFYRNNGNCLLHFISHPNFEFFRGDVTDRENCYKLCNNVDGIIHCAALVGEPICSRNKELAWLVNYSGTSILLSQRLSNDIPFIYCSTGSCYGKVDGVCTESSPVNPLSVYGRTKLEAEKLVEERENTISLRFATGMGVSPNIRFDLLVNDLCLQAKKQKSIVLFQPDFKRTFINVKDMCSALIFCLENCEKMVKQGKKYNCGANSLNWSKRRLAEYIKGKTGCSLFFGENGYTDPDQRDYEVSVDAINTLGWRTNISMEETVDDILKCISLIYPEHNHYGQKL